MENITFTVVDPVDQVKESRIYIDYEDIGGHDGIPAKPVTVLFGNGRKHITIGAQQLAELGALFLALAGSEVDFSGADALLEGYGLKGKAAATKLAEALEE